MATIDKIYGTTEQWDEFWTWCKANLPSARPYFYSRDGYPDDKERPIANFPRRIDKSLMEMANSDAPPPMFVLAQLIIKYIDQMPYSPKFGEAVLRLCSILRGNEE